MGDLSLMPTPAHLPQKGTAVLQTFLWLYHLHGAQTAVASQLMDLWPMTTTPECPLLAVIEMPNAPANLVPSSVLRFPFTGLIPVHLDNKPILFWSVSRFHRNDEELVFGLFNSTAEA